MPKRKHIQTATKLRIRFQIHTASSAEETTVTNEGKRTNFRMIQHFLANDRSVQHDQRHEKKTQQKWPSMRLSRLIAGTNSRGRGNEATLARAEA
jgi:hypothetical protein